MEYEWFDIVEQCDVGDFVQCDFVVFVVEGVVQVIGELQCCVGDQYGFFFGVLLFVFVELVVFMC